jgi:hypothetical protein
MSDVTWEEQVQIRDVYDRMYWAFNRGDGEGFKRYLTDDAVMERYNGTTSTRDETAAGAVKGMDDPVRRTWQHHITNFFVDPDPDGDPTKRKVSLYVLITAVVQPPAIAVRWSTYSHDIVEKVAGEWKIQFRRMELNDKVTG